jgi:hypothetical protein
LVLNPRPCAARQALYTPLAGLGKFKVARGKADFVESRTIGEGRVRKNYGGD